MAPNKDPEVARMDALATILSQIETSPFDLSLHVRHIQLTTSSEGMGEDALAAMELLSSFFAVSEDIWMALISAKENSMSMDVRENVEELLALYERAENDYLSISILYRHAELLVSKYEHYVENPKSAELGDCFSVEWTRAALTAVVEKGQWHLSQSHRLWNMLCEWELQVLEQSTGSSRSSEVSRIEDLILTRLKHPHANLEDTFQMYSSFTTKYKSSDEYESLLVRASKLRGSTAKVFQRRDSWETSLAQSPSLETYSQYITAERRAKTPHYHILSGIYERALAQAAKDRLSDPPVAGLEDVLQTLWTGYLDTARILRAGVEVELEILQRAVRSVPGSGNVWARYIRSLERAGEELSQTVSDVFDKALATNLLQSDVEQLVPLLLARAGYDRRQFEASNGDEERFVTLIAGLETGIGLVHGAGPTGDPRYRVEKFLSSLYSSSSMEDSAIQVWEAATKKYKSSYNAWILYTDTLIKHNRFDEARKAFIDVHSKNLDWPEAVWEAWLSFEHLHGTVEQIDECGDKIEKAQIFVNTKRAKAAEKQAAEYAATVVEQQQTVSTQETRSSEPMDVDSGPRGVKRAAEDATSEDGHKKAKLEPKPANLKRDRENSTVFVAELPIGVTEQDLEALFKDCGKLREIKITELAHSPVATVEFFERDSVPAALTKDKKRLHGQEVAVHMAWSSTLYVTNFAESADDASIRDLFGKARPFSKRRKGLNLTLDPSSMAHSSMFFTTPSSAQAALELHGRELHPGFTLNVLISNPERKKDRTDQDANERELYIAGLSKFTTKEDLQKVFQTYGTVKDVRMATDPNGHSKGYAFVEFEDTATAQAALDANNHELKKRRIAVTLADSRVRSKNKPEPDSGLGKKADTRNRSIRVRNLPPGTEDGLLQQALEKITAVKRVEVFVDLNEAVVELNSSADVGKLLLRTEPVVFNGNELKLTEEGSDAAALKSEGVFVPRAAKPRAGLGHRKANPRSSAAVPVAATGASAGPSEPRPTGGKGQDDFRKMLG
ncbi:unnamed protein product [Mycena citricolor]|uniref:RRM domain-containing protein n=1 Tax=Mycena citricolor TaxID=2018698 RepID=A0AAD2HYA3_9AGAR|nr:unnamed protein product [Mycena citricolor]